MKQPNETGKAQHSGLHLDSMRSSRQHSFSFDGHQPQQGGRGLLAALGEVEAEAGEGVAALLTLCQHA